MKLILLFLQFVLLFANISCDFVFNQEWKEWKNKSKKAYTNLKFETIKYNTWLEHKKGIDEHNARYRMGQETYIQTLNEFHDMTYGELLKTYTGAKLQRATISVSITTKTTTTTQKKTTQ